MTNIIKGLIALMVVGAATAVTTVLVKRAQDKLVDSQEEEIVEDPLYLEPSEETFESDFEVSKDNDNSISDEEIEEDINKEEEEDNDDEEI